ncbi:hypothetical protein LOC67_09730 [Stieleria sp. JC731]|uniref:hypothetical protein n=1 Tax=Pirellulaceae TaxID=2691357 RepID=UPI001E29CD8F|nr:hypothetical protein [Stieleria sp. JC731]MCC9600845.1 hypothetical protein [Stieleria sp. JC731]
MTTDSTSPRTLGAVMSSEAGYESPGTPLRISGFIALILALISGFATVALPMLAVGVLAILFALIALRKTRPELGDVVPVGTSAARWAIILSCFFCAFSLARYGSKYQTLGNQAEYFARQFVRVASSGNSIYANELQKSYVNRYLKTMPLEIHYENERKKREAEMLRSGNDSYEPEDSTVSDLVKYSPDHDWVLWRPVRVYNHYGRQKAEVILAADHSKNPYRLRIELEYLVHKDKGTSEWYVEVVTPFHERLVAESIL